MPWKVYIVLGVRKESNGDRGFVFDVGEDSAVLRRFGGAAVVGVVATEFANGTDKSGSLSAGCRRGKASREVGVLLPLPISELGACP